LRLSYHALRVFRNLFNLVSKEHIRENGGELISPGIYFR